MKGDKTMNAQERKFNEHNFDDMLAGIYGNIDVCGYSYPAEKVLKKLDPIAYDYEFNDWSSCEPQWECGECREIFETEEEEAKECCSE